MRPERILLGPTVRPDRPQDPAEVVRVPKPQLPPVLAPEIALDVLLQSRKGGGRWLLGLWIVQRQVRVPGGDGVGVRERLLFERIEVFEEEPRADRDAKQDRREEADERPEPSDPHLPPDAPQTDEAPKEEELRGVEPHPLVARLLPPRVPACQRASLIVFGRDLDPARVVVESLDEVGRALHIRVSLENGETCPAGDARSVQDVAAICKLDRDCRPHRTDHAVRHVEGEDDREERGDRHELREAVRFERLVVPG